MPSRSSAAHVQAPASTLCHSIEIEPSSLRTIETCRDPRWQKMLSYWCELARARKAYPAKSDIEPARLGAALLPNTMIIDVVEEGFRHRFRYRLMGQAILDRVTTRPGQFLDEVATGATLADITRHYEDCLRGKVRLRRTSIEWTDIYRTKQLYTAMVLPLADDGHTVTHLIGIADIASD